MNFSIAAIARKCGISVYKYLNQDIESAVEWVTDQKTRRKKLDPYRDVILGWLKHTQICPQHKWQIGFRNNIMSYMLRKVLFGLMYAHCGKLKKYRKQ